MSNAAICDRCGKVLEGYPVPTTKVEIENLSQQQAEKLELPLGVLHLCKDCTARFIKWLKTENGSERRKKNGS